MQFKSSYILRIRAAAYSIPVHFHPSRRKISSFIYQIPRFLQISFVKEIRHRWVNLTANQYQLERIMTMGPDFACMEWLMNAGATSVKLSDGTVIGSQNEMRKFLTNQGFDVKKLKTEAPKAQILKHFEQENQLRSSMASDSAYDVRWPHISPIHLKEVDATDAVIDGKGCKYFLECRNIEKLKLNFNDFLTDIGLEELSKGRPARTLKELEMCYVPCISDACAPFLCRLHGLQRLHLYALGGITKRDAVRRLLIRSLPKCRITFPKPLFIGYGYETEEQKAAFQKYYKEEANIFMRWLNDESSDFFATKDGRYK